MGTEQESANYTGERRAAGRQGQEGKGRRAKGRRKGEAVLL